MVMNYKRLNQFLEFDVYFILRKDVLVKQTAEAKWFSKFDLKSRFWQIKLTKESKPLTAFSAPYGHYQWTIIQFGICNAPQIFHRWMDNLFKHLHKFCLVYIDDVLLFSKAREEHKKKKHLEIITDIFLKNGIIFSPKKIDVEKKRKLNT